MSIYQDKTKKREQLKIVSFTTALDGSVGAEDIILEVPLNTGEIAKAAMLKGFNEFFYRVISRNESDVFDQPTMENIESILKNLQEKIGVKKSGLVLL